MERVIHPAATVGAVGLTVGDLDRAAAFYQRAVGLRLLRRDGDRAVLGAGSGEELVELVGDPAASERPPRTTGLFHLAIVVPDRAELARALGRVPAAGATFTGAADHLVSEALYLDDPEGNGIEIYRDRPREEWPREDGGLVMATLPLDLDGVLASLPEGAGDEGMPDATRMGHVHLQVRDIAEAEGFYCGGLGLEPTVRGLPGALFVAAGGYHHHVGLNTWGTRGAPPPPGGARGLRHFRVLVPDAGELARVVDRLEARGTRVRAEDGAAAVTDPSGNRIQVAVREAATAP